MNKASIAAALTTACFALPAHAIVVGFTGPYAPGTWTTTFAGNLGSNSGSISNSSAMVVLTGGNAISPNPPAFAPACTNATAGIAGACEVRYVTTTIQSPFSFDWTYATADSAGANDDLFGILVNGVRTELSDPGGSIMQTGHVSVAANASFGWYLNCTDCIEGAAVATITNFRAGAVPEPMTIALLGLGGVAAGVVRRARRPSASTA